MSFDIRLPNINASTDSEKLAQIRSYLYQFAEQMRWALNTIETGNSGSEYHDNRMQNKEGTAEESVSTFNSIKPLIIKSADIVNAYYEEISKRIEGEYVALSDFGTYTERTANDIQANSTAIEQFYTNLQKIVTDIEMLEHSVIGVNAHINSGLLYYDENGVPVYGLEIGQRNEIDGVTVFNKYARFTANKLSFYDQNSIEVAYISDYKLYITNVEVTGSYRIGGFIDTVLSDGSVVTKWIGGV